MSKKEQFIKDIEEALKEHVIFSKEGMEYFEQLKSSKSSGKLTENGIKIISFMKENEEKYNNTFTAKNIAEGLFISSRIVSGAMRKLVEDEYVEKEGSNPVNYIITDKGRKTSIN